MKEERFNEASRLYDNASIRIDNAQELLDEAQGVGRQLPHLLSLFRHFRCILPVYRDTSQRFADSFEAFRDGEREKSRKIAREAIVEIEQEIRKCGNSADYQGV